MSDCKHMTLYYADGDCTEPYPSCLLCQVASLESKLGAYQSLVDDLYAWAFSRADQTEIAAWIERAKELKK